ncbi:hypothetical protein PTKIN_Ptkin19aG0016600 [Pterospermum kingtungense]
MVVEEQVICHLQELTDIGIIHSVDQSAKPSQSFNNNHYAIEACPKMETELVGYKNLQELEIHGTMDITDAGGEELALRIIETSRLGICTERHQVDESMQRSDSREVRTEMVDRLIRIGSSKESPAVENNSASKFDGKVESEKQSYCVSLDKHSVEIDDQVVEDKNITVAERGDCSLEEHFSEEQSTLLSIVKTSCVCNQTQVSSIEEHLQKKK